MNIVRFLTHIKGQGVEVRLKDEDHLQLKAKTGALTTEIREKLQQNKTEILTFLKQGRGFRARTEAAIGPVPEGEERPLSFAQERLGFLEQLHPDQAVFLLGSGLELEGFLDVAALYRGFLAVIERHESLRTAFVKRDARPVLDIQSRLRERSPVGHGILRRFANRRTSGPPDRGPRSNTAAGHDCRSQRWSAAMTEPLIHRGVDANHYAMMTAPTVTEMADLLQNFLRERESSPV